MASLQLTLGIEVALNGKAQFTIDPSDVEGKVEIWERTILFPPPGQPVVTPKFKRFNQVFGSTAALSQPATIGGLYEVLLYKEGEGKSDGSGDVLDRRSFPSVNAESRTNFMTKCTEKPQIDIKPGGTFLSMSFAGSAITQARVQLGTDKPQASISKLPVFPNGTLVADAFSIPETPKFVHQMQPTDARILPGTKLFFSVFEWDINGSWDYIWGFEGIAPGAAQKDITTLKRSISVKMQRLGFVDDSDAGTNGEGSFTLFVHQGSDPATDIVNKKKVDVATFETGTSLTLSPPAAVNIAPTEVKAENYDVIVQVTGFDDDSGSFPSDDDDTAATDLTTLELPIGEGKEEVIDRYLSLTGNPTGGDDTLRFTVDLTYSVSYS